MLKRVLIANRGEIALRVIRACRELDVETVAVYSTADENSLAAQLATRSLCIGPARAADSYLNQEALLSAGPPATSSAAWAARRPPAPWPSRRGCRWCPAPTGH